MRVHVAALTGAVMFAVLGNSSGSMATGFCDADQARSKPFSSTAQYCAPRSGLFAAACKGGPNLPNPCCCVNGKDKQKDKDKGRALCSDPQFANLSSCDSRS